MDPPSPVPRPSETPVPSRARAARAPPSPPPPGGRGTSIPSRVDCPETSKAASGFPGRPSRRRAESFCLGSGFVRPNRLYRLARAHGEPMARVHRVGATRKESGGGGLLEAGRQTQLRYARHGLALSAHIADRQVTISRVATEREMGADRSANVATAPSGIEPRGTRPPRVAGTIHFMMGSASAAGSPRKARSVTEASSPTM